MPTTWLTSYGVSILVRAALVLSTLVVALKVPFFGKNKYEVHLDHSQFNIALVRAHLSTFFTAAFLMALAGSLLTMLIVSSYCSLISLETLKKETYFDLIFCDYTDYYLPMCLLSQHTWQWVNQFTSKNIPTYSFPRLVYMYMFTNYLTLLFCTIQRAVCICTAVLGLLIACAGTYSAVIKIVGQN